MYLGTWPLYSKTPVDPWKRHGNIFKVFPPPLCLGTWPPYAEILIDPWKRHGNIFKVFPPPPLCLGTCPLYAEIPIGPWKRHGCIFKMFPPPVPLNVTPIRQEPNGPLKKKHGNISKFCLHLHLLACLLYISSRRALGKDMEKSKFYPYMYLTTCILYSTIHQIGTCKRHGRDQCFTYNCTLECMSYTPQ